MPCQSTARILTAKRISACVVIHGESPNQEFKLSPNFRTRILTVWIVVLAVFAFLAPRHKFIERFSCTKALTSLTPIAPDVGDNELFDFGAKKINDEHIF